MTEPTAAVRPTNDGIEGEVVRPPWWDDPAEQGREMTRLLTLIAGELSVMNTRLQRLESLLPQRLSSPLAGLLRGGRP